MLFEGIKRFCLKPFCLFCLLLLGGCKGNRVPLKTKMCEVGYGKDTPPGQQAEASIQSGPVDFDKVPLLEVI